MNFKISIMKKTFKELPVASKVWVYQAENVLSKKTIEEILSMGTEFIHSWESHGSEIPASIDVFYNQFVVISADDCGDTLCGRAKDGQLKMMKEMESSLGLSLTNRMITSYKKEEKIETISFNEFKNLAKKGEINKETIVFNNLVETKNDFLKKWETPAQNSWHNQFLN